MLEEIKGKINTISTSKIKNINIIKKNRIENGLRRVDVGSNPHSNGDIFSRTIINFLEIKKCIMHTRVAIVMAANINKII